MITVKRTNNSCNCFKEYCEKSSIHGVCYLTEDHRPGWERIFWIIVLITSGAICVKMVQNHWNKWGETPVIVSFNDRQTEIWKIPFPAVTICPEDKINGKNFDVNILKMTEDSLTREEKIIKQSIAMICDPFQNWTSVEDVVATENDVIETLQSLSPIIIFDAYWQNQKATMEKVFLDQGICYTFNMLKLSEIYDDKISLSKVTFEGNNYARIDRNWDRENGYKFQLDKEDYPKRSFGPGIKLAFMVVIVPTDSLSTCSVFQGYKVSVHPPDTVPQLTSNYFRLPLSQDVVAAITPNMLTTSNGVKEFSPEKRQCYFNGERNLKYFKLYTTNNCEIECITDFTLKKCNCVSFAMPKLKETKVCVTTSEMECAYEAEDLFLTPGYSQDGFRPMQSDCNCLPHCTNIEYNIESSSTNFDIRMLSKSFEEDPELRSIVSLDSITSISFFYKEASFLTSKRSELYGLSEFVASCGGLFGLFLGMSMLSFAEILYFSVIRVLSNRFRNKH